MGGRERERDGEIDFQMTSVINRTADSVAERRGYFLLLSVPRLLLIYVLNADLFFKKPL